MPQKLLLNYTFFILFFVYMTQCQPKIKPPFKTILSSYRHVVNRSIVKWISLELLNNTYHGQINGSFMLAKDIEEFEGTLTTIINMPGGRKWTAFNITADACEMLAGFYPKTIFANILPTVVDVARNMTVNLPRKCPIIKDVEISIINAYIDPAKYVPNIPDVKFIGFLSLRTKGVTFYNGQLAVEFTRQIKAD